MLLTSVYLQYMCVCVCASMYIQWNLFIKDTVGTQLAVLYREVFLSQR